jgi:lipopolysaccharide/colanic/teichoic acid biosynthesis glycosyltransferase
MYRFFKRCLDIFVSLAGIIIFLPVLVILCILIKLGSKGPAVFKQTRAGKNGEPFTLYKFRTMRTGVDPFGASPKSGQDTRLTNFGKFMREYSLDELPQLINVIKGDMSIVGPRPLYMSQMAEWDQRQKERLLVKPGLTGLAQVSGRGELTREQKLELDVKYVEKANFWYDIKIILFTFGQVFGRKSIYEDRYSQDEVTRGASGGGDEVERS